jgi:hypothetical protein
MTISAQRGTGCRGPEVPNIFQEYFKNILKIFMQNSQALK